VAAWTKRRLGATDGRVVWLRRPVSWLGFVSAFVPNVAMASGLAGCLPLMRSCPDAADAMVLSRLM